MSLSPSASAHVKFAQTRAANERSFEALYDEACVRGKSDALFESLVSFPSKSVNVERLSKEHRSPAQFLLYEYGRYGPQR